jgi:hypothetical protein
MEKIKIKTLFRFWIAEGDEDHYVHIETESKKVAKSLYKSYLKFNLTYLRVDLVQIIEKVQDITKEF